MTMARSAVLIGSDTPTASCDVDFLVILRVVGLKVGFSVGSVVAWLVVLVVVDEGIEPAVTNSASLKMTFRLVRTILLTGSHSRNIVMASYSSSHSFSDRGPSLPSS